MSEPPISYRIELGASRRLAWLLGSSHAIALVAASLSSLPGVARVALGCLILASAFHTLRTHAWRSAARAPVCAEKDRERTWRLIRRDGSRSDAMRLDWAYVQTWGVILGFRRRRFRRETLLVMGDAVGDETLRRLTVALRLDPPGIERSTAKAGV